jgi:arylsulfatase A-like enzyme
VAAGSLAAAGAEGAPAHPNVVLIVTDDQALGDLYERTGSGEGGEPLMPQTLSLIRDRGVTFERAYSSNPLSCPSRSSILTGQYAVNHRIFANRWPDEGYCSDAGRIDLSRSLPVWLRWSGYRTLHYGRFLNGWGTQDETRVAPGWDEWVNAVDTVVSPAALYYGYHLNENGVVSPQFGNPHIPDDHNYFTDVIVSKAIVELQTSDLTQPFFLSIDHRAPHEDLVPPIGPEPAVRHSGTFPQKRPPRPASFNEEDVSDKAPFLRDSRLLTHGQLNAIRRRNLRRLRSLRAVDDGVGYLFEALDALGELDETYVIFTSDNGFLRGEHRFSKGKRRPYEPATRIPLLIMGPGIPAGEVSEELVSNVDIAPTIVNLAGAITNRTLDGRSLIPYAVSPTARSARPILLESYYGRFVYDPEASVAKGSAVGAVSSRLHAPPQPTPRTWKGIVLGRWKLIRFGEGVFELYDLERDPDELRSLARLPRFEPVLRYLARRLERLAHCAGSDCRVEVRVPKLPPKLPRPPKPTAKPKPNASGGGA